MKGTHRKDIDGLRAVAILPVLFYHANIWPFAAGYVGVDIFFVLSGYLITGLILREHAGPGFSLANFYDRRARRILPALGVVLAVATIAALFILLPDELVTYGKNLLGAVFFVANFVFWARDGDYFVPLSADNPLLHIWSLAVEEQFYVVWPLLLVFLTRFRGRLPWIVGAILAASLALTLFSAHAYPIGAFYSPFTRAWQLLTGALLSCGAFAPPGRVAVRNTLALAGPALIAAAIVLPGSDTAFYHPLNAVGAALGTALILFAADGGPNIVSAALATRVPAFIGLVSYSLYLWHWPALVYTRLYLNRPLATGEAIVVLLAAFVAAVLSWRYVEQPLRRRAATWRGWPASFPVAVLGSAALAAVAGLFVVTHGLPLRVPEDVRRITVETATPLRGKWCEPSDASADCRSGSFSREAVVWGDSHARALAPGLIGFAARRQMNLRELTTSACPPLPDLTVGDPHGGDYPKCSAFNRAVLARLLAAPPALVILTARWDVYFAEHRIRAASPGQAFSTALAHLLDALGARRIPVLVVGNVPRFAGVIPGHCYGRERMQGRDPSPCMTEPWQAGVGPLVASDRLLFQAVVPRPAFARYHPAFADLCDRAGCHAFSAGHVLYIDEHHLSPAGAALVGQRLDAAMRNWPP
jgi:peptidoglycan/LPS O-acetylase OafA/YrhL